MSRLWKEDLEDWEILLMPIKEIKGVSRFNARKTYPDKAIEGLVISLKETGINTRPIILDQHNEVVEGNRRYLAAKKAGLKQVFCLRKYMTPKEAKIRSFIENELSLPMTEKDRYLFVKDLKENEGMDIEEIAHVTGRAYSTIYQWLSYDKFPRIISDIATKEVIQEETSSARERRLIETTLDLPAFKEKPDLAHKFAKEAPKLRHREIEDFSKEVKTSGVVTEKQIERLTERHEELEAKKYEMIHTRFTTDEYKRLVRAKKLVYPDLLVSDVVHNIAMNWVYNIEKEKGLML